MKHSKHSVDDFVYELTRVSNPDCTPAWRGAFSFRRAKKAGWEGDGGCIALRRQWEWAQQKGREQALEWWGPPTYR